MKTTFGHRQGIDILPTMEFEETGAWQYSGNMETRSRQLKAPRPDIERLPIKQLYIINPHESALGDLYSKDLISKTF